MPAVNAKVIWLDDMVHRHENQDKSTSKFVFKSIIHHIVLMQSRMVKNEWFNIMNFFNCCL